jgi:hypothetical protein
MEMMMSDGWVEWKGGECPVAGDTEVFVRYRDGLETEISNYAGFHVWQHVVRRPHRRSKTPVAIGASDIIAYRVVSS